MRRRILGLSAMLFALFSSPVAAVEEGDLAATMERVNEVRALAEQASVSHPFAGTYTGGFTTSIAPDGRYAEVNSGCFGVYDAWLGHVTLDHDELTFTREGKLVPERRVTITRWGEQRWLLDADNARSFVDFVNGFGLPTPSDAYPVLPHSGMYRVTPEADIPTPGTPLELPGRAAELLRPIPVEVHVTTLLENPANIRWDDNTASIRARIDAGKSAGVFAGMSLYATDRMTGQSWLATVTDAAPGDAVVKIDLTRFDTAEPLELPPTGIAFSSQPAKEPAVRAPHVVAHLVALDESFDHVEWGKDLQALMHGTIDRGTSDGLRAGTLMFPEEDSRRATFKIESADAHSSRVKLAVDRYSKDETLDDDEKPVVGMMLHN